MKRKMSSFLGLGLLMLFLSPLWGNELVESQIESLGVFKNGNVLVQETIQIPNEGQFILKSPSSPIHGTFFIESNAIVSTKLTEQEFEFPISEVDLVQYPEDLIGLNLQIELNDELIEGKIVHIQKSSADAGSSRSVLFEKNDGTQIIIPSWDQLGKRLIFLSDSFKTVKRKEAVLIFDVKHFSEKVQATKSSETESNAISSDEPIVIRLSYLTKGISWMPSYRIDMGDSKQLSLEQTAILFNEWKNFENVPVSLISGFPQIEFDNVLSPMSPNIDLNSFFASLSQQNNYNRYSPPTMNNIVTQQMVLSNSAPIFEPDVSSNLDVSSLSEGDQPDAFYQNIGIQSLKKKERIQLTIAKKDSIPLERIICWDIADIRDNEGRIISRENQNPSKNYARTTSGNVQTSPYKEPWDILRFKNPFDFPLTTGPVSIFGDGKFYGQNMSFWYNPNEEIKIPINKALSIRANSSETERTEYNNLTNQIKNEIPVFHRNMNLYVFMKSNAGHTVSVLNNHYRVAIVDAVISLENLRNSESVVYLRRELSGELIPESILTQEDSPQIKTLTSENQYYLSRINRLHELSWTIKLQPGEKKNISFSYLLMIR